MEGGCTQAANINDRINHDVTLWRSALGAIAGTAGITTTTAVIIIVVLFIGLFLVILVLFILIHVRVEVTLKVRSIIERV